MVKRYTSDTSKTQRWVNGKEFVRAAIFFSDFALLNAIFIYLVFVYKKGVPEFIDHYTRISWLVMNFMMLIAEFYFHTIIQKRLLRVSEVVLNSMKLVATQVVLMFVVLKLLSNGSGFFMFMLVFGSLEYAVILASRFIERWALNYLRRHGRNVDTVLLVGNDPALLRLYMDLTMSASVGYKVLGYFADQKIRNAPSDLKHLGSIDDLNKKLDAWDDDPLQEININEVFCSLSHEEGDQVMRIARSCDKKVIRFYYVPRIFEHYEMNLKMQNFGRHTVYTNRVEPLTKFTNRFIKRLFDICFSFVVLLFLIPITIVVGIIIKLQSPGPIFFRQSRTGIDGRTFNCYKFRSMHVNKDADKQQATKDDPRKFPFGNFMRKANIDELPQFYNVIKGDMSIVGPRPHMLHHTEVYGKLIDRYMVRHFCKPGITGWAQVTGFRGETELWQMEQRVKRDIWYIEHWSFLLDLKIIYLTTKSVFIHDKHAY